MGLLVPNLVATPSGLEPLKLEIANHYVGITGFEPVTPTLSR